VLFTPTNNRVQRKSNKGVVGSSGASGSWMRRLSFPVQTNTKASNNWRATFLTTKQNWAALGPGGSGYVLVGGWDPQSTWLLQSESYFGIIQPGLVENNIRLMSVLKGCATPDAYYTMVQANRASLGLDPLPTPTLIFPGGLATLANPCPTFAYPTGMSSTTVYDDSYTVTGFSLVYRWLEDWAYPMAHEGIAKAGVWEVVASDAYTSSYSPPDPASWSPILFTGPYLPNPSDVLASWVDAYGPLPNSGSIKFQLCYIDPDTGASGPALSCTAGWENGTLKGFNRAGWSGPLYGWYAAPVGYTVTAPGSNSSAFSVYGLNGYGGSIAFKIVRVKYGTTFGGLVNTALPKGTTFSITPNPAIIPPGSAVPVDCTFEATSESGADAFWAEIKISANDGLSTLTQNLVLEVAGVTSPQPEIYPIYFDPGHANPHPASPGTATVAYTLYNSNADDIDVVMQADSNNPGIGLEFDKITFTVPGGSFASPGSATVNLTITVPADTDTDGIQIQVAANAGIYSGSAGVMLSL